MKSAENWDYEQKILLLFTALGNPGIFKGNYKYDLEFLGLLPKEAGMTAGIDMEIVPVLERGERSLS